MAQGHIFDQEQDTPAEEAREKDDVDQQPEILVRLDAHAGAFGAEEGRGKHASQGDEDAVAVKTELPKLKEDGGAWGLL